MYSYHPSLFSSQIFHMLNILGEQTVNLLLALVFSSTSQFGEGGSSCALVHIYLVAASLDCLSHSLLTKPKVLISKKSDLSRSLGMEAFILLN